MLFLNVLIRFMPWDQNPLEKRFKLTPLPLVLIFFVFRAARSEQNISIAIVLHKVFNITTGGTLPPPTIRIVHLYFNKCYKKSLFS